MTGPETRIYKKIKQNKDVLQQLLSGLYLECRVTEENIGIILGLSRRRIGQLLKKYDIVTRHIMVIPEGIAMLYSNGKSQREIGNMFGVSQALVSHWMRRLKISAKNSRAGTKHPRWKGGIIKRNTDSRYKVWKPSHPRADGAGYVYRSILVWEEANGPIPVGHEVHHRNELTDDDCIENLELLTVSAHIHLHRKRT
jgi:hypothetical protein